MQDQAPYGELKIEIQSPFQINDAYIKEVQNQSKLKQALESLGQYVDNASDDDGHNDKVVDIAYKLLQEVVNNGIGK